MPPSSPTSLQPSPGQPSPGRLVRRVAVVGGAPLQEDCSRFIDESEVVIRFNSGRSWGGHGGTRTTHLTLANTGQLTPQRIAAGFFDGKPFFDDAREIWLPRDPERYRAMERELRARGSSRAVSFVEVTAEVTAWLRSKGKAWRVLDARWERQLNARIERERAFWERPWLMASTGMVVLEHVLGTYGAGERAAFAGARDASPGPWPVHVLGFEHGGWKHHPWRAERKVLERWAAEGVLRLGAA